MVICLRCGWCCRNISPLVTGNEDRNVLEPCPMLEYKEERYYSCKIYDHRPKQCKDEHMGVGENEYCPLGLLALENEEVSKPTGKCMYCGSFTYGDIFCSEEHAKLFEESLK